MNPADRVIAALDARNLTVRGNYGRGWTAQCPAHEDRNASLSIAVGDDERALLRCFAGCATEDIVRALGMEMRELFANEARVTERAPARRAAPLPTEEQLAEYAQQLASNQPTLDRLYELRGWTREAMTASAWDSTGSGWCSRSEAAMPHW